MESLISFLITIIPDDYLDYLDSEGSVLVDEAGVIIARGHNMRVQTGDPTAHAEMVAIK